VTKKIQVMRRGRQKREKFKDGRLYKQKQVEWSRKLKSAGKWGSECVKATKWDKERQLEVGGRECSKTTPK